MSFKETGQVLNTKQCTKCTKTMALSVNIWRCQACHHQETARPSTLAAMYDDDLTEWKESKCKTEKKI